MKRLLLPIVVVLASGGYVWSQQGRLNAETSFGADAPALSATLDATASTQPLDSAPLPLPPASSPPPLISAAPASASSVPPAAPELSTVVVAISPPRPKSTTPAPAPATLPDAVVTKAAIPLPRPRPTPPKAQIVLAAATVPAAGTFKDGSYRGPAANAYYGEVQVQADIRNGQLVNVKILKYPNDRRTSRYINSQALPMLQQEAIQAQSGKIDYVSGATLSSGAFVQSLTAALNQAL
jgi:uncharacterized protein with FMN-binding domain